MFIGPVVGEDILAEVDGKAHEGSEFHNPWRTARNSKWKEMLSHGDIFSIFKDIVSGQSDQSSVEAYNNPEANKSWYDKLIDAFTGATNTEKTNAATAALQEDAQAFNAEEAQKQRDFEANQAEIARQWQENMSNSAVQRQAADLKAAGFNPWLATNGSGASTGSVGIASGDSASSAQGQAINATKSGADLLAMAGITAASIIKIVKMLK